jgi:hypothetical protein
MCVYVPGNPYRIVLDQYRDQTGNIIETFTYAVGKVTRKPKHSEHISTYGFTYPIGRTVFDPNAQQPRPGQPFSHDLCLHFFQTLNGTGILNHYGSHRLIVLPAPQVWGYPAFNGTPSPRCVHSVGCTPLFCLDCFGLQLKDLKNPDFWRDMTKPRIHSSDDFVLPVPRNNVWHRQVQVNPSHTPQYALGGKSVWPNP